MHRFFVRQDQVVGSSITISGTDAHHISRVLRMQPGDEIECIDEQEQLHITELKQVGSEVVGLIKQSILKSQESPLEITLFQALAKGDKMDFIIQKAVELGVKEIIPFASQRAVVKLNSRQAASRLERWERIALEAAKQCGRTRLPKVGPIQTFGEVTDTLQGRTKLRDELVLIAYEEEQNKTLQEIEKSSEAISVIIGPEGGFAPQEIDGLQGAGGQCISLGPRILRTETAGLVAISMLGYKWGDLA